MKKLAIAILAVTAFAAQAQTKETTIRESNGRITTVTTDNRGTTVSTGGSTVYTSGGDRHKEQVDYSTRQGGTVIKNK